MVPSPARAWLDRYERPFPIRSRGAFHVVSAVRRAGAEPCVVVVPSASTTGARAAAAFQEIERVHALLDHPLIPRVAARGDAGGTPYLELDCDATLDGVEVHELLVDMRCKIPFHAADGLLTVLREALVKSHSVVDPVLGRPVCLGQLCLANLLFARSGRLYLAGYGHNFPTDPGESPAEDQAPLAGAPGDLAGEAPTPAGDLSALRRFVLSLLPLVDAGPALAQLLGAPPAPATTADLALTHLRSLSDPADPGGIEPFLRDVFDRWAPDARRILDAGREA